MNTYFKKDSDPAYVIYELVPENGTDGLRVCIDPFSGFASAAVVYVGNTANTKGFEQITEDEFMQAHETALKNLSALVPVFA